MNNFITPTKEDLKRAAKYEFRQNQEAARKERIFNPRRRLIGIDKQALDDQVEERKQQLQDEQNEKMAYDQYFNHECEKLNKKLYELSLERVRMKREIDEFRRKHQRFEQSRDFDLNDPNYLLKTPPDQGQTFLGEDPISLQRHRLQLAQQKSWLEQQMYEQNEIKKDMDDAKRAFDDALNKRDVRLREIDQEEKNLRRQMQKNTAQYNLQMAREQKAKRIQQKKEDYEDNLADIVNHMTSDILTENRDAGLEASQFGPHRAVGTMFRGMSDEQLEAIRMEQLRQIEQKKLSQQISKEADERFDDILLKRCDLLAKEEQQHKKLRHQQAIQRNQVNTGLAQELKDRVEYLNTEVYVFKPTDEYFENFNTTTR